MERVKALIVLPLSLSLISCCALLCMDLLASRFMVSCSRCGMEWLSNNECGKSMAKGVFNHELLQSQSWHIWAHLDKRDPHIWTKMKSVKVIS